MTSVTVKRVNGRITAVESRGHTGFAENGSDIVCAALSTVLQTGLLGLLKVAGIDIDYRVDEEAGFMAMALPQNMTEQQRHDADVILETMTAGVADLSEGYSDFIKLEVI